MLWGEQKFDSQNLICQFLPAKDLKTETMTFFLVQQNICYNIGLEIKNTLKWCMHLNLYYPSRLW